MEAAFLKATKPGGRHVDAVDEFGGWSTGL